MSSQQGGKGENMDNIEIFKREAANLGFNGIVKVTGDFQCDQTGGFPVRFNWNISQCRAWLEPYEGGGWGDLEEALEKCWEDCAAYGIRQCETAKEFNGYLKELAKDIYWYEHLDEDDEAIDIFAGRQDL